jgi:hypothetical protein
LTRQRGGGDVLFRHQRFLKTILEWRESNP